MRRLFTSAIIFFVLCISPTLAQFQGSNLPIATNNIAFGPGSSTPLTNDTFSSLDGNVNFWNSFLYGWGGNAAVLCIQGNRAFPTACPVMGSFATANAAAAYTGGDEVGIVVDVNSTEPWLQNVVGTFTSTTFTPSSALSSSQISNLHVGEVLDTNDATPCSGIITNWAANGSSITTMGFYQQGSLILCNPPSGNQATIRATKIFGGNIVVNLIAGAQQTSATGTEYDCNNQLGQNFGPTLNGGRLNCLDLVNLGANQASEAIRIRGPFFSGIDMSGAALQGAPLVIPRQTPSSSSSPCTQGGLVWDASFSYACLSSGVWSRATLWNWPSVTVSSLPSCGSANEGQWASVSDASSPTYNAVVSGGGTGSSGHIPVYCNGSNWTAH